MASQAVAVVTGGGGGIGSATARKLASKGWAVVVADQSAEIATEGYDAAAVVACDVTNAEEVRDLLGFVGRRFGRLDGFFANAGISGLVTGIADYPEDVFDRVISINLRGTFLCLKHALPLLREGAGGSFVATASTSAIRGRGNLAAYVASKHGVLGLVRSAAMECVGSNVRVNAVLPGPIHTPMIDEINAMAAKLTPGGTIQRATAAPYGQPEDVANTVAFLLSPDAAHLNGAEIVVDGGSTAA